MKPLKAYIKAYDGDNETASKVYHKVATLSKQPKIHARFNVNLFNKIYQVLAEMPQGVKLVVYTAEWVTLEFLLAQNKLKRWRKDDYIKGHGIPGFYVNQILPLVKVKHVFEVEA